MAGTDQTAEVVQAELVPVDGDGPGTEVEPYVDEDGKVMIHGAVAAQLAVYLAAVPVDNENGNQRIAEQLLMGDTIMALNAPWESSGGRALAGRLIRVDSIQARPSRYKGGLRAFLVAECMDGETGERTVMTTSAMAPVIQLARVNYQGWLPAWCVVEVADKPTENGFYPYHLRFVPPPAGR